MPTDDGQHRFGCPLAAEFGGNPFGFHAASDSTKGHAASPTLHDAGDSRLLGVVGQEGTCMTLRFLVSAIIIDHPLRAFFLDRDVAACA